MNSIKQFDWVTYYEKLALQLLYFKNKREELIEKVYKIYDIAEVSMPTLEKDNELLDIDPFTFFGLFNKSSMKEENRTKILSAISELFDINQPVPTSFDSIPVLNNQNATYYHFIGNRSEHDIDDLWELFDAALAYASESTAVNRNKVSKFFDLAINKKGNGNSKITMGLYWIAPDSFLNLDQRNTWYIYDSGRIPKEIVENLPAVDPKISSSKYFDIVEKLRDYLQSPKSELNNFKELSLEAWRYSEEVNEERRQARKKSEYELNGAALADNDVQTVHYWIYSPGDGASIWDECYDKGIMAVGWDVIGDLRQYKSKDEMKQRMKETIDPGKSFKNAANATWQFVHEMKAGDIVFAKKGMYLIIGRGVVESDYEYDSRRNQYKNIRKIKWTHKGEWQHPGQAVMKTLTDITAYKDYVDKLEALFESDVVNDVEEQEIMYPVYTSEKFLEEVFMDKDSYEALVSLLLNKKNIILQGAPGVGKTFVAKRLAYSIMGVKDPSRVMMVQFHQSYSYEDFIMGFRPSEKGFVLRHGAFYNFCKEAELDSEREYFFIIDEINRGNLSKILGELFMLIENDKRGVELQLLYSDEKFSVPANVYIIGMMNTADRSLALLDYALRRRFAFYEMKPGFASEGFLGYQQKIANVNFDKLIDCVESLNAAISSDESLGEGFCIGHSFFCNIKEATDQVLSQIVEYEIIPLLKEYWFDEPGKVKEWTNKLRDSIK